MINAAKLRGERAGFTLAELLVSTALITVILGAAYVAFNSALRTWRTSTTDYETYQSARTSIGTIERDLQGIIPGAAVFMEGEEDRITFIALVPPMQSGEGNERRVMQVTYRVKRDAKRPGSVLVREEREVESALPVMPMNTENPAAYFDAVADVILDLGREEAFEIAPGVESFQLRYYWTPPVELDAGEMSAARPPIELKHHSLGRGLPAAIGVTLVFHNPDRIRDDVTATTRIVFHTPTSPYDPSLELDAEGGLP